MGRFKGIGIVILAVLLVEIASIVQYRYIRGLLGTELERRARVSLAQNVDLIRNTLMSAEATMQEHVWDLQSRLAEPDSMYAACRRLIQSNSRVVGGDIAFIPDYYPQKGRLFEPYAYKEGGTIVLEQLATDSHDYTLHPAFQETVNTGKANWSDPYLYEEGGRTSSLTTYSYPLRDREGRIAAVCGLDIDLSWLSDTLNARRMYPSSYSIMLTAAGEPVVVPAGREDIDIIVGLVTEPKFRAGTSGRNGRFTAIRFRDPSTREKGHIYYTSMRESPYWQIATVNYDKEQFEPAYRSRLHSLLLNLLGLLVLSFIVWRFARGERRLQQARVEQARIGSELQVARDIQSQMLPKTYPPFPERHDIDICGSVEPAREVGGDLFDFFIRDGRLFFCIGDVSGKGVPSAMLMTVTHSLFRLVSEHDDDPARIMQAINESACRDNRSNMFVTFFVGSLDLATGCLRYCNAGHDWPFVVGRTVEALPVEPNLPVGVFDDFVFKAQEFMLPAGDTLFLYTDGLTEAMDVGHRQFTAKRVRDVLQREAAGDASALLQAVSAEVRRFTEGAEQSDDLTMLAIRYTPEACPPASQTHNPDKP